jgi:hypothetical protein
MKGLNGIFFAKAASVGEDKRVNDAKLAIISEGRNRF